MNSSPSFRLALFAHPSLAAADGAPVAGRVVQRHRLALLALLARAPRAGVSREVLMAYLWPEKDLEQARNLLNVSVYVLRQALGERAIISGTDGLRLSPELLDVDVRAFEEAIDRGDLEGAVSLYGGPFLEGFFLPEALEFGQWVDRERTKLSDAFARTLESLAESAEAGRNMVAASEWWKERAAHDPYDSRVALRLMRALAASGSRAGALQHAKLHEQRLRDELEIEPDPEVRALAERLRAEPEAAGMGAHGGIDGTAASVARRFPRGRPGAGRTLPADARADTAGRDPWWHRRGVALGVSTLLVALLALAVMRPWSGGDAAGTSPPPSIAVLPLSNRSDDPEDAVLADGMTAELIATLSGAGLRTISSTSVFALRNRQTDVRGIADSLGVSHVLEGDWQRTGSDLRVRLRLVDGGDGSVLWSKDYQRQYRDVFAVQAEIAREVVEEMGTGSVDARPLGPPRPATTNVAAWELYLRADRPETLRSDATAREALALFRQAATLDSTFAGAHAGLARAYLRSGTPEEPDMPRAERFALAEWHAMKATDLDPSLAEAHATMGLVKRSLYEFDVAESEMEHALELDPSSSRTREWLVDLYVWEGRYDEALAQAERALADDPLSPSARAEVALGLLVTDRCDEALRQLEPLQDLQPPLLRAAPIAAQCHAGAGRWAQAVAVAGKDLDSSGIRGRATWAYFLARSGREAEASQVLDELLDRSERLGQDAFWVALVYEGFGRIEESVEWLDRSIDDFSFAFEVMQPIFADARMDPRFDSVLRRVGLR